MANAVHNYPVIQVTIESTSAGTAYYRNLFGNTQSWVFRSPDAQSVAVVSQLIPGHHYKITQVPNSRDRTCWTCAQEINKRGQVITQEPVQVQLDQMKSDISNLAKILEAGLLDM